MLKMCYTCKGWVKVIFCTDGMRLMLDHSAVLNMYILLLYLSIDLDILLTRALMK